MKLVASMTRMVDGPTPFCSRKEDPDGQAYNMVGFDEVGYPEQKRIFKMISAWKM